MGSGKSYEKKVIEKEAKESHKQSLPDAPKHVTDEIFVNNWRILNDFDWLLNERRFLINESPREKDCDFKVPFIKKLESHFDNTKYYSR